MAITHVGPQLAALPDLYRGVKMCTTYTPPTLKDTRRLLNKKAALAKADKNPAAMLGHARLNFMNGLTKAALEVAGFDVPTEEITPRDVDRAISALGPDWPVTRPDGEDASVSSSDASVKTDADEQEEPREEGESRPKDTDEVAEVSDNPSEDAELHGGDGNSGEVDHEAETVAPESDSGEDSGSESGEEPADGESGGNAGDAEGETGEEGEGLEGQGGDAGEGESSQGQEGDTGDNPGNGGEAGEGSGKSGEKPGSSGALSEGEGGEGGEGAGIGGDSSSGKATLADFLEEIREAVRLQESLKKAAAPEKDGGPLVSKTSHGGVNATYESILARLRSARPRDVEYIRRALEKILNELDDIVGLEQSPRLSARRLVTELASRRVSLPRIRREELQPGVKLLLCDVSGSCSAVCDETLLACAAVLERDPQAVLVVHSNGHPSEVHGKSAADLPSIKGYMEGRDTERWWSELLSRFRIIGSVNWGDWDAGRQLQLLAERAPLVWLDSYCASTGEVRPASRNLREGARSWRKQPMAWYQGVNNARTTAIALRDAARTMKRR